MVIFHSCVSLPEGSLNSSVEVTFDLPMSVDQETLASKSRTGMPPHIPAADFGRLLAFVQVGTMSEGFRPQVT